MPCLGYILPHIDCLQVFQGRRGYVYILIVAIVGVTILVSIVVVCIFIFRDKCVRIRKQW